MQLWKSPELHVCNSGNGLKNTQKHIFEKTIKKKSTKKTRKLCCVVSVVICFVFGVFFLSTRTSGKYGVS